ncbi:MAG: L-threonylcarbamoyladenylate synthase [Planctomycetota bacterium]
MDGPEAIAEAVGRLRAGGLVAFPTETVYGLGADARRADAVQRVFETKGRPSDNPLIVHVSGEAMAALVVRSFTDRAVRLAAAFWPGPLTFVLERSNAIPDVVTAGGPTVGVRCPDHPLALALIESFGGPLVGPSANPSGYISPTSAAHVLNHFGQGEVLVLDGGACKAGLESTVIDLTSARPRVLRPGIVGVEHLAAVLGEPVDGWGGNAHGSAIAGQAAKRTASPGLIGPHYQPRAAVVVVGTLEEINDALPSGSQSGVVLAPPGTPITVAPPHTSIPMPVSAHAYASELYAALRDADDSGAGVIVVALPSVETASGSDAAVWAAVRERLGRASGVE